MVSISLYQTQFTNGEWDAIERALITMLDVSARRVIGGDDQAEIARLTSAAESALLKVELENHA